MISKVFLKKEPLLSFSTDRACGMLTEQDHPPIKQGLSSGHENMDGPPHQTAVLQMHDHRFWFEKEQSKFAEAELKVSFFGGNISFFQSFETTTVKVVHSLFLRNKNMKQIQSGRSKILFSLIRSYQCHSDNTQFKDLCDYFYASKFLQITPSPKKKKLPLMLRDSH